MPDVYNHFCYSLVETPTMNSMGSREGRKGSYEATDSPEGGWLPKGGSTGQTGGDEAKG